MRHEVFVRAHGGGERGIAPWNLFSLVVNDESLVALDRLCRIVRVLNFLRVPAAAGRLFLNLHGRQVAQPDAMQRVIALARDAGARPIFTRVESIRQRDYLQALPDVLLQGRALAWPSVLPATGLPREFAA